MKRSFTDMLGFELEINFPPQRIVSLVPSQTELLFDLGLNEEVVGITKFCVHPESWFRNKTRVGGTKQLHLDQIKKLQPDLIIANKEENTKDQINELRRDFPVWTSDIKNVEDALLMMSMIGMMVNKRDEAYKIINEIRTGFSELPFNSQKSKIKSQTAAYLIWYKPWMAAGGDTFISDMMQTAGFKNVFQEMERYPEISLEQLAAYHPELVLLSSEPFPFKEKHVQEIKTFLPQADVKLVDGEMFSWYGSRMKLAVKYFETI